MTSVAAGSLHSLAVTGACVRVCPGFDVDVLAAPASLVSGDGEVMSWGRGSEGQLGHGNSANINEPKSIEGVRGQRICSVFAGPASEFSLVATGASFTTLLDTLLMRGCGRADDGALFSFGSNYFGQLGLGREGRRESSPCRVDVSELSAAVTDVSGGYYHTLVLCGACDRHPLLLMALRRAADGAVYACGSNNDGQLGLGRVGGDDATSLKRVEALSAKQITAVACGYSHSVALAGGWRLHAGCWLFAHYFLFLLRRRRQRVDVGVWYVR